MRDILVNLWLAFMLFGYAMTLFFEGGLALGFDLDLFLPAYALMLAGVALGILRSRAPGREPIAPGGPPHA